MSDRIIVGVVTGAFGVKGEVRVKSFCATPEDIALYTPLFDAQDTEYTLKITRPVKGGFAARLSGIRYRDQADALRGTELFANRDQLPQLPDDEFYYTDLIGLEVVDTGGITLGKVTSVDNHGAGDILEIRHPGTKSAALLPFTRAAVPTVDLTAGRIIVDPPEGVFGDPDT